LKEIPELECVLRNDVACFAQDSRMPAKYSVIPVNINNLFHASYRGLKTNELIFMYEKSIFDVGVSCLKSDVMNQID
jgi:hypothetical protein